MTGGSGNDIINGGTGVDTAIFSGNFASYTFGAPSLNGSGLMQFTVTGPDGTDTLTGVERLQFADQTVAAPFATQTGDGNANTLNGTSAVDYIFGAGGNDTITGGGGQDSLNGRRRRHRQRRRRQRSDRWRRRQ